jgi:hypothetical protein
MTRVTTIALAVIGAAVVLFLVGVILFAGTRGTGAAAQTGSIEIVDGVVVLASW